DIDELIQQVRIRLWKYPPKCKLSSAVFNAVKCILIQELKKRKNTKIVQLSDEIDIGYILKEEPSLDNLTKVEQEVIQMKMQGYTHEDIANKLGVVHQRVSQLIHSARRKY